MTQSTNQSVNPAFNQSPQATLEQRKIIYRARRGLKELDYYFDPYVREHFLQAGAAEQAVFARLITQEDPDLLDWFLYNHTAPDAEMAALIMKLKQLKEQG